MKILDLKNNFVVFSLIFLSAAWTGFSGILFPPPVEVSTTGPKVGLLSPSFDLESINGGMYSLRQPDKPLYLLNFFASWCPPCKSELPAMQRVFDYYKEYGVEIYAISNLQQDSIDDIQSLAESTGIQFPVLLDKDGSVFDEYLIRALPTTLLVNSNGRVLKVFYGGPLNEIILSREINLYLGGK